MILGWGWKRHAFFVWMISTVAISGPLPTLRKILWDGERRWPDQRVPWWKLRGHVSAMAPSPGRWGFSSCACADRSVPWCREDGASSGIFLMWNPQGQCYSGYFRSSQESGYVHFLENHKSWGLFFRADSMQSVTFAWSICCGHMVFPTGSISWCKHEKTPNNHGFEQIGSSFALPLPLTFLCLSLRRSLHFGSGSRKGNGKNKEWR